MTTYEYSRYCCDKTTLLKTLDKYGVAIIPQVLNKQECENMLSGIWDYFEHISVNWNTPIKRDNIKSYLELYKLFPSHSMLYQFWNIGHSQVSWDIRQNTKIIDIWKYIYNCEAEELLSSFDGLSFNLPPEITKRGWYRNNNWLHCDQSFTRNNLETIQSWVTALDVNKDDATLTLLESSNKFHKYFKEEFQIDDRRDWYKLDNDEHEFYLNNDCKQVEIICPAGSLVFWDSRTIHSGIEAKKSRLMPNIRAVIYLCYLPRKSASQKDLIRKQKLFNEMRTCCHNPVKNRLFSKLPRTYGNNIPDINHINKPILNKLGFALAGF